MHFTSPLSSILWRRNIPHSAEQKPGNSDDVRYLKATLLLSSVPLTTTPVAPPERTANTYESMKAEETL